MLSRRKRVALLALLTALSMVNLIDRVDAQSGSVRIATDLELLGVGGLGGGGHVTWTLTGGEAQVLRTKILNLFDGYAAIPAGFAYGGNLTGRTGVSDGILQATEASKYTDFLENELEGIQFGGSRTGIEVRFVKIDAADILEKGFPLDRSTDGLVLTTATSAERLEIRFIFNARTISENWRVPFSDVSLADGPHPGLGLAQVWRWPGGDFLPPPRQPGWGLRPTVDGPGK